MPRARDDCNAVFENRFAILMARIVDRAGMAIRPSWVAAIDYSIFERRRRRPTKLQAVPGHFRVSLRVGDVLFDSLKAGGLWTLDVAGYNFRHKIDASQRQSFSKAGATYVIGYIFTTTIAEKTIVEFELGAVPS